jgi:hypothetical protein
MIFQIGYIQGRKGGKVWSLWILLFGKRGQLILNLPKSKVKLYNLLCTNFYIHPVLQLRMLKNYFLGVSLINK